MHETQVFDTLAEALEKALELARRNYRAAAVVVSREGDRVSVSLRA